MKPARRLLVLLILCAVAMVACGKRPQPVAVPSAAPSVVPESPPPPSTPPAEPPAAAPPSGALTEEEIFARKTLEELNAERPLADAFFDFDQWQIRDDARASLQRNAEWLQRWSSTSIMIEGHCDARGTSEYNLALGDRRANSVRSYLVSLGISSERLLVVSKGKETPFCTADTEECWQQNRRGYFVITAK
jgi:peptidoglycan-associated lipoprotein